MPIIKHNRDNSRPPDFQRRFLMHIPIGLLIGIPIIGAPLRSLFERYEENEDLHTRDEAWKDYAGAICGALITEVLLIGLVIWYLVGG